MRVEKIGPNNYKQGLLRIKKMTCVVLVYHPQCGHCIQMRSSWEAMKPLANPRANIVEVNAEGMHRSSDFSGSTIAQGTNGFPSVMMMKNNKIVKKYDGERSPEKFAEFVNQSVEPESKSRSKSRAKARPRPKAKAGKTKKLRRR
jgi:thioredoxin-like negative regulator of GroEL